MRGALGRAGARVFVGVLALVAVCSWGAVGWGEEPPNPFGQVRPQRTDAVTGFIELSDGTKIHGKIYLTRGHYLHIYDPKKQRFRDVPLQAVKQVRCIVEKEWMEKEWRFKENANNQKVYTGRQYPVRKYVHEIELKRGGKIRGPLAGPVYIVPDSSKSTQSAHPTAPSRPLRFLLHKRQKGKIGESLKQLVYVKRIVVED